MGAYRDKVEKHFSDKDSSDWKYNDIPEFPVWKEMVRLRLLLESKEQEGTYMEVLVLEVTEDGGYVKFGFLFDGKTYWDRTENYHTVKFRVVRILDKRTIKYKQLTK
jgi:hypothetical protein